MNANVVRPNVLLICVDHWPGRLIGAAGNDQIITPTLDNFCANGVRYSNAYSATPTCIPARRALMTGTTAQTHGDRTFSYVPMPDLLTMPQAFRNAGYQAFAVGKLHVTPARDRIGFDDVILNEEGRHQEGPIKDDYERYLEAAGFSGEELTHAMGNNTYTVRPWHLSENLHPTNWTTREMCRVIQRRDPTRPAFWYCSYSAPHPPVTPPAEYLDLYRDLGVDEPYIGKWATDADRLPYALRYHVSRRTKDRTRRSIQLARQGFYGQCTYIDHQLRLLIGTLKEQGLLDDTIVMFVSDHGDMLGNHGLWAKPPMYEFSANIPMILVPTAAYEQAGFGQLDDRLAELRDVMPTLLDLCGISIPDSVEGISIVGSRTRDYLYCEHYEDERSMRMVRSNRYKLIYYPAGNVIQMFDLHEDPNELNDLAEAGEVASVRKHLTDQLIESMWGSDERWITNGMLNGMPAPPFEPFPDRDLSGQRGWR